MSLDIDDDRGIWTPSLNHKLPPCCHGAPPSCGAESVIGGRLLDSGTDSTGYGEELVAEVQLLSDGKGVAQDSEGKLGRRLHHVGKRCKEVFVSLGQPVAVSGP
ncbi:MAG: hypothetical protein ACRDSL_16515 [Pseudonocardiaceae bacterium]